MNIGIKAIGIDGFIDTGSTWLKIDTTFCMFLQSPIHSFHTYCVISAGPEGDHMACATNQVRSE